MKIKLSFILFSFLFPGSPVLFSQDYLDRQYQRSVELFNQEKYFDAVTEFKRLLFFDKDSSYTFEANNRIAQSYRMGGKYPEAIQHYIRAQMSAPGKEDIFRMQIEIVKINILRRTTGTAMNVLNEMEAKDKDPGRLREINYWRGWAYIFADDWENAAASFREISPDHELALFSLKVDKEKYSINLARILSVFIPGAGQFYTGHYLSGLLSLSWNLLWGFVTINSFLDDRIFDGFMVGNFLWLRFYRGNIQNAENFAEEENLHIVNKALHYLQYDYEGFKP